MKKSSLTFVFLAAAGGLVWLIWLRPAKRAEEEAQPPTEVPVHVAKITRATLRGYVTAYGTVEAEPPGARPAASARVAPSVPGVVVEIRCAEGQRVEKGALLFQLDSRAADLAAEFAAKTYERQQKLMQVEGTSQKLLWEAGQALAVAQTQQALLRVQAPLAGTVARVNVRPGEAVDLTSVLAEVIDLDRLVVSANVPSPELATVKAGQPAEVAADPPAPPVGGWVTWISPQLDARTGTALVRVALPASSGLRPGQWVALRIVTEERKDRLTVPTESVVKDAEGNTVIALVQNDQAALKPVKVGLADGGRIEVAAEGLQPDMAVVTAGAYGLPKETKVRVLEK